MPSLSEGLVAVRPLRSEADYERTLQEIETLFSAPPGTPDADRLDVLTALVEAYEAKHHPVPPPDPVDALLYHLESRGLGAQDLAVYLGGQVRAEEVLSRRRALSIQMIRRLHNELGLPAEVLIRDYPLRSDPSP